jgi:OFA family oxalate/formate antiporter-like MFS transporter
VGGIVRPSDRAVGVEQPTRGQWVAKGSLESWWWQIVAAVTATALVSSYQYVWSSIRGPLARDLGLSLLALGLVFTLFVLFQSGSQFPAGWLRDRYDPRVLTLSAGVLAGGGYLGLAHVTRLWQIYALYSLGAIGVGIGALVLRPPDET